MRLSKATQTEIADLDDDLALLPVGSMKQHDLYAPLGTDALDAELVAEVGADVFDDEVIVGPAIPVNVTGEHRVFDGALRISSDAFRVYVREAIESLAHHGFDRVVIVSDHDGDIDTLAELCRRISRTGGVYAVVSTRFNAVGDHSSDMDHGDPLETALLHHTHPELVHEDRIDEAHDGGADRWGRRVSGVNLAHDSDKFTGNGVVGDPAKGDADHGARLGSFAADSLTSLLGAVESQRPD